MEHTPGPWKRIAIGKRQVITSGHGWLVECPARGEPETELQAKRLEADYDLMAAAPELLEVCKLLLDAGPDSCGCDESGHVCGWPNVKWQAEQAIAKAEGKATV